MGGEQMQPPVDPKEATILVVEDNLQNFVLIARLLGYLGVRDIQWKASGWQVLEFAGQLPRIDLILLDIHLPYEDGYEVLRQIRADPRFRGTRVVAVSAEATEDNMRRAREAGFDGFIGKPIDPDAFPDQIRRILAGEGVWTLG
ncbi:response regulator [Thermoflexus hugenholtzii]|jgi:FOG: CheY-like receiver|uniref:Two-component system, cell cycle response regulator DivK n=1 Tax=Thermoflexus hugenholtzii JAD2 TaxID=877466 RepID=A0A212Q195_9CHLR|nr:response regulator [Thermoflexus hugenholtzii]SNB53131.1 two-component system, cell cycle response regulator DivK [Thermoflexus hugenholtzii JAD2]